MQQYWRDKSIIGLIQDQVILCDSLNICLDHIEDLDYYLADVLGSNTSVKLLVELDILAPALYEILWGDNEEEF